jgi:branched-subunit amino acid transport protein
VIWVAVLTASLACYLLKLAGLSVPAAWMAGPRRTRVADLLPVAVLAGLVVIQTTIGKGGQLVLDARAAGLAAAVVAVLLRAPFLVVVVAAASTAALLRAVT